MKLNSKLKQELQQKLQKELKILIVVGIIILVILKIAFHKEPAMNVLKLGLALIYFSLLPGFSLLLIFSKNLNINERVALSFPLGLGLYGIFAYYLNLFVDLSVVLWLPLIITIISIFIYVHLNQKNKPIHETKQVQD